MYAFPLQEGERGVEEEFWGTSQFFNTAVQYFCYFAIDRTLSNEWLATNETGDVDFFFPGSLCPAETWKFFPMEKRVHGC